MIYKVRRGVFETNSSSTHSITMCSEEEYNAWIAGQMVYDCDAEELVSLSDPAFIKAFKEELITNQKKCMPQDEEYVAIQTVLDCIENNKEIPLESLEKCCKSYKFDYCKYETYNSFFDDDYSETYSSSYKAKSGEEIIAFGKYSF